MMVKIALAVALHGVEESALDAASARLLRPPPAKRTRTNDGMPGTKGIQLRGLVARVIVVGVVVIVVARV